MNPLESLLDQVDRLVTAVEFDDGGVMVGMVRTGGNGGLLSVTTIAEAGKTRLAVDGFRQVLAALPSPVDGAVSTPSPLEGEGGRRPGEGSSEPQPPQ